MCARGREQMRLAAGLPQRVLLQRARRMRAQFARLRPLSATGNALRRRADLRSRLDATQERVRELGGSLTAFSQQVAAIKPEIVHANKMSDEEMDAY